MAKLKAPLLSLGASGKLADSLVFMHWKGIDDVREYVIPTNPKTGKQTVQRNNFKECVEAIHTAQALEVKPLGPTDITAYSQWGLIEKTPRTWFNQIIMSWRNQYVLGLKGVIYRGGTTTPGDQTLSVEVSFTEEGANTITAGKFWLGKTRTALITSADASITLDHRASATLTGLTNGQKYYIQFRPTAHADFVGAYSGIYTGTPHA